jgi:hypothetical protein
MTLYRRTCAALQGLALLKLQHWRAANSHSAEDPRAKQ